MFPSPDVAFVAKDCLPFKFFQSLRHFGKKNCSLYELKEMIE